MLNLSVCLPVYLCICLSVYIGSVNSYFTLLTYLFVIIVDYLGLLVPLKPHHVLGMEAPALLFKRLGRKILSLGSLHVVEYKEERLRRESLIELNGVIYGQLCLRCECEIVSDWNVDIDDDINS